MFCGPETVDVPESKPSETSTVGGPQNILLSTKHTAFPRSFPKYFIIYQESKKRKNNKIHEIFY